MLVLNRSTVVLHKYLNDEKNYFACYNFAPRLDQIKIPELLKIRENPEYSRFSRFMATLIN